MKLLRSIPDTRRFIQHARTRGKTIGFVPTMGALHPGHLSLIHLARKKAGPKGLVVVSIFVNPAQFNQQSDLAGYPRRLQKDLRLCKEAGADGVFVPPASQVYPPGFSTWVEEQTLALPLCGARRPGHFRGVCTVVLKLFNMVQPDFAVLGEKDAQQLRVLKKMAQDLDLPVEIIPGPTVRELDGLAMSSRNERLSPSERTRAREIPCSLLLIKGFFIQGERRPSILLQKGKKFLSRVPGLKLDYLELVDDATLQPVRRASRGNLLAIAAFMGKTRLIDNIRL